MNEIADVNRTSSKNVVFAAYVSHYPIRHFLLLLRYLVLSRPMSGYSGLIYRLSVTGIKL